MEGEGSGKETDKSTRASCSWCGLSGPRGIALPRPAGVVAEEPDSLHSLPMWQTDITWSELVEPFVVVPGCPEGRGRAVGGGREKQEEDRRPASSRAFCSIPLHRSGLGMDGVCSWGPAASS